MKITLSGNEEVYILTLENIYKIYFRKVFVSNVMENIHLENKGQDVGYIDRKDKREFCEAFGIFLLNRLMNGDCKALDILDTHGYEGIVTLKNNKPYVEFNHKENAFVKDIRDFHVKYQLVENSDWR